MSSDSPEDAALAALLRDAEVTEDVDPLGLPARSGDVVMPPQGSAETGAGGGGHCEQCGQYAKW